MIYSQLIKLSGILLLIFIISGCTLSKEEQQWINQNKDDMSRSCFWLDFGEYWQANISDVPSCYALQTLISRNCKEVECTQEDNRCICKEVNFYEIAHT